MRLQLPAGRVQGLPRVTAIAAGRGWGAAVGADGSLRAWGSGLGARPGDLGSLLPARVPGFGLGERWGPAVHVAAGEHSIAVVTAGGQVRLAEAAQTQVLKAVPVGKCWVAAVRLAAIPQAA